MIRFWCGIRRTAPLLLAAILSGIVPILRGQVLEIVQPPNGVTPRFVEADALSSGGSILVGKIKVIPDGGGLDTNHIYRWSEDGMDILIEGEGGTGLPFTDVTGVSGDGSTIIGSNVLRWDNGVFSPASEENDTIYGNSADGLFFRLTTSDE